MHKAIKYIALSMAMSLIGITSGAKQAPGIPPVYTPQGSSEQTTAWKTAQHGAALRELDSRSPDRLVRSLIQNDGIIDVRPDRLKGISDPAANRSTGILTSLPKRKIPGGSNLCGFISYNEIELNLGVYRLPLAATQQLNMLRDATGMVSTFRGGASNDRYYVMSYYGMTIQNGLDQCLTAIFDKNDWTLLAEVGDYGEYERVCSDMTYDPITERFYGCFLTSDQSKWVLGYMQFDKTNPATTINKVVDLSTLEVSLNGLAADADGVLWGIRNDNGALVKIDKKTGAMTTVAQTGFVPGYNGSLTFDNTNGIFYWAVSYEDKGAPSGIASAILTVDPKTGALSHVYDFSDPAQTCGLYTEFTAGKLTPGTFTALTATFNGESLSGTITFDAPATLTDGTTATGNLEYTLSVVKDNGYVAYRQEKSCNYGNKGISIPIELKTAGQYTITVQGHNNAGKGYPATITKYIGSDLPQTPGNIKVAYDNSTVTVSWDAVTSTIHGGYHDPNKVSYNVTLSQVDADGNVKNLPSATVTTTQAEWQVEATDALQGFNATVTPVFGINSGETAATSYKWFGALTAPFVQSMTADIDGWTTYTVDGSSAWQKVDVYEGHGWAIPFYWGVTNNAWLFSPAIKLEKGHYYQLSFTSWTTVVDQPFHVWIGRNATVEDMNTKLLDCVVSSNKKKTFAFGFECKESGIYYLGIHNDTNSSTWTNKPYTFINNVTCDAAPNSSPAAPELVVDYDQTGEIKAKITITAPSKSYDEAQLEKLDKVVLTCDGKVINQWDEVEPGATLTYDFEAEKAGTFPFIATATSNGIDGVPAFNTVYLGVTTPVDPEWVEVAERAETLGTVDITWAPVNTATNGQAISSDVITYNVMNILSNTYVKREITEPSFVYEACDPESQTALYISVNAQNIKGKEVVSSTYGTMSKQGIMHVGKPYQLPMRETFADGTVHYNWSVVNQHSAYDRCAVINTASELGDKDANGDGYCLLGFVPYENSQAAFYSGRIEVPQNANNPVLGFAVYRVNYGDGKDNDNTIAVGIIGSKTQGQLKPVRAGDQNFGWQYYYYDMSSFKGQTVNLLITFQTNSYTSHYIDDIHFFDAKDKDLAVTNITVPATAKLNKKFSLNAAVTNLGTKKLTAKTAKVELRRGDYDTPIATRDLPALSSFQTASVVFSDILNSSFDTDVKYKAVVVYEGDEDDTNDSAESATALELSTLPAPQSLTGERNEEGFASLSWQAPDLTPNFPHYEIGFESSIEPSMTELEGFTSIDVDGNDISEDFGNGAFGFISFYHPNLSHSGNWMVVSPCNANGAAKEDWLISPKLSGKAQTISFYARTNWSAFESFSVLTSTTGSERADFTTSVLEMTTSSNDWKRIDIEVPDGTLYFAIVSKADDTTNLIYLMLDDFSFDGADTNDGLTVVGYNTYRDNTIIEQIEPVETWNDIQGNSGPHFYRVTARYENRGESAPSNELFLFTRGDGLDDIAGTIGKVYSRPGHLFIEGAGGCAVTVTAVNGMRMAYYAKASDSESIALPSGVYIVTINGVSVKVLVR